MKVIKVINSLDFGGIEKVLEIVAKYYKGNQSELIFIALGGGGKAEKSISAMGFTVITLNMNTRIPNFKLIWKLVRLFKKEKPHVVHSCGGEGNFHGLLAAWIARVPVRIGEEIGMPSHSSLAKRIFKFVYNRSTAVIAVANTVLEYVIRSGEATRSRVHLIYNPVDVDHYHTIERNPDPKCITLLSVCRLHPIKNLESLLRSVKELVPHHPNLRLWIVGEGAIREDLEKLTNQLQLTRHVTFFGFQADPGKYLAEADFFVLPSFSEGHPVSVVEAMIAGVPAIVTNVGGAPEILTHGESGWLITPTNPNEITNVLREAISTSTSERNAIATKAKEIALSRFSPERYYEKLNNLYRNGN